MDVVLMFVAGAVSSFTSGESIKSGIFRSWIYIGALLWAGTPAVPLWLLFLFFVALLFAIDLFIRFLKLYFTRELEGLRLIYAAVLLTALQRSYWVIARWMAETN
ncbi:hypothetical protein FALBO_2450 [Fusarium albosuccineum]|uniref:Uncharacterized protein n=1 Tax=Fusarium albosuccineum TaxID=1237068 RepID=A0A8H4LLG8_9HYPO|nr:hypothetical protein FALBO_2450 [Fusarium albosuccineum]